MPRPAQLALTVLFSTYSVSETLKFCELGDKLFEALTKNSSWVVYSSADSHDRSPSSKISGEFPDLATGKNMQSSRESAIIYDMLHCR
jgi:hypothetical protein